MKQKTISCHYGGTSSLAHNNRDFTPRNVDPTRSKNNNYRIAAGHEFVWNPNRPEYIREFWAHYHALSDCYWTDRCIAQTLECERYQEHMKALQRLCWPGYCIPQSGIEAMVTLFLLPLLIPCGIYLSQQQRQVRAEWEACKDEQWLKDMEFRATKLSFRQAMGECDKIHGRQYLNKMDTLVTEMAQVHPTPEIKLPDSKPKTYRYATVEEIYDKVFEPGFRTFQARQHPSRRYEGTYLEQVREKHAKAERKHGRRNCKAVSEVIELLVCIGDMNNTGYEAALEDALKSQDLLDDFMDHLLDSPNIYIVTTKELDDPNWKPPFKNGLIIVNMTGHYDEATPGIHITVIPYSRGYTRGAEARASLGQAMKGMGYSSTWIDVLDVDGNKIPKRDKEGNLIRGKDGTVRYQQKPDKQGIVDWIEVQKFWLEREMLERYGWQREYKGRHPRGHLETSQYKAACALEQIQKLRAQMEELTQSYAGRIEDLTAALNRGVDQLFETTETQGLIQQYLLLCPDEDFKEIEQKAVSYLDNLPAREQQRVFMDLQSVIENAQKKAQKKAQALPNATKEVWKYDR